MGTKLKAGLPSMFFAEKFALFRVSQCKNGVTNALALPKIALELPENVAGSTGQDRRRKQLSD